MKNKLMLIAILLFSCSAFAMEEKSVPTDSVDSKIPSAAEVSNEIVNLDNIENNQILGVLFNDENQGVFSLLPLELIVYILNLIVEDSYARGCDATDKFVNIISNKDLANMRVLSRFFKLISDQTVTNLGTKLVQANSSEFERELSCDATYREKRQKAIKILKSFLNASKFNIYLKDEYCVPTIALEKAFFHGIEDMAQISLDYIKKFEPSTQLEILKKSKAFDWAAMPLHKGIDS